MESGNEAVFSFPLFESVREHRWEPDMKCPFCFGIQGIQRHQYLYGRAEKGDEYEKLKGYAVRSENSLQNRTRIDSTVCSEGCFSVKFDWKMILQNNFFLHF